MDQIPAELHYTIARHLRRTPLQLATLEMVNNTFKKIYGSQQLWGRLDPYHGTDSRRDILERIYAMTPNDRSAFLKMWRRDSGLVVKLDDAENLDLRVAYHYCLKGSTEITDKNIAKIALFIHAKAYMVFSPELKCDMEMIELAMQTDARLVFEFPRELRAQKKYMTRAIMAMGSMIRSASPELQDDKEFCLMAVDNHIPDVKLERRYPPLKYVSERLRDDKDVVIAAVRRSGSSLMFASSRMKQDEDVVRAAVAQDAIALIYAAEDGKTFCNLSLDTCRLAIDCCEYSLQAKVLVGEVSTFRQNPELLRYSVSKFPELLAIMPRDLALGREEVLNVLRRYGAGLQYACKELRDDDEAVLAACNSDPTALKWAAPRFLEQRQLVLKGVAHDGSLLKKATSFHNDLEIVLAALKNDKRCYKYVCPSLRQHPDVLELGPYDVTLHQVDPSIDMSSLMAEKGLQDLYDALNF